MIQRVQSLVLLLIAVLMVLTLAAPLYSISVTETNTIYSLSTLGYTVVQAGKELKHEGTWLLAALAIAIAGTAGTSVFLFKNRKLQLWLGFANSMLLLAYCITLFYYSFHVMAAGVDPKYLGTKEWGFYLPLASFLLNFSANRLIRQDEKLVRSMDRIR